MEAPPIRYARTSDGVNIAFTTLGDGPPLIYLQPFSNQQLDWTIPELREWLTALAASHQVIRYDTRRFGLSDRPQGPLSIETFVEDLSAVVDAIDARKVDLLGISGLGLPAIAYAAHQPQRVGHLVLWGAVARGNGLFESPGARRVRAVEALFDIDPELVQELVSRLVFGEDAARRLECITHTVETVEAPHLQAYTEALRATDVTPRLPQLRCPTLLMLPRAQSLASADDIRMMATTIRSCELSYCEGEIYPHRGTGSETRLLTRNNFLVDLPTLESPTTRMAQVLTRREIDVLDRLARGSANQEIARALGLSVRTVERHITNLYRKIDARGRTDATVYALTHGLGGVADAPEPPAQPPP